MRLLPTGVVVPLLTRAGRVLGFARSAPAAARVGAGCAPCARLTMRTAATPGPREPARASTRRTR